MLNLKNVPIDEIIKALRKIKGVISYTIDNTQIIEIDKTKVNNK